MPKFFPMTVAAEIGYSASDLTSEELAAEAGASTDWTFGTGANSARISRFRPHENPAKTKMSMSAGADLSHGPGALGVIRVSGHDAARFLQGQLSADMEKLAVGAGTLAGLHNPQGRTVAVLAFTRPGDEEFLAALPRALLEPVAQRLRKFVLRAKVGIEDLSGSVRVIGVSGSGVRPDLPSIPWGDRRLTLAPAGTTATADIARWLLEDVRQGLPQVHAATSEAFVAQMLNLDLLGAVSFDKGCYTGQEVIARAHYRGRVKRRLQRWLNSSGSPLEPGAAAQGPDGRALTVLYGAPVDAGRPEAGQEVLAVGSFLPRIDKGADEVEAASTGTPVSGPLPLPYSLPE
jgi:folate-binding protein YgfZ